MGRGTKRALIFGTVPFLTLVFALPFVNRAEPFVLGLPFVLLWVALTPVSLFLAYKVEKKYNLPDSDDAYQAALPPDSAPSPIPAPAAAPGSEAPR